MNAPQSWHVPTPRPTDLPPLDTSLVDFDRLYGLGAAVLEPVPEVERPNLRYWRGAHIGKIAMNFARGDQKLNAGYDDTCHFIADYTYALNTAKSMIRKNQLTDQDKIELSTATGYDPDAPLPRIVLALDQSYNDSTFMPSEKGNQHGLVLRQRLTLDMIDPHSRLVLVDLLGISE